MTILILVSREKFEAQWISGLGDRGAAMLRPYKIKDSACDQTPCLIWRSKLRHYNTSSLGSDTN